MKRKLIITNSIIVFVSLLTMLVVSMITITNQNNKFYQKQVTNYLKIACTNFDGSNFDDTKEYIKSLDKDIRLTIIESSTGKVVIDSFEDEINENHLDRPEINNLGEVYKRYSTTEKKNMLYVAEKVNNYYVRIAIPIGSVNKIIYTYVTISLIALTVILAFSIFAISFVNKKSLTPINSEVAKLATLANEDYQDVTIDDLPVVINSITNVLDNKIHEIELQEQEIEAILNLLTQGVVVIDSNESLRFINYKATKILDSNNNLIGKNYLYLFRDTKLQKLILEVFKNHSQVNYLLNIDSTKINCNVTYLTEAKLNGGIIITLEDITKQANLEEEKRDFFQNASHELKSPLTSIIGYQQMICDNIVDSKDQIINYSSKTLKEAKRMNNIIIDMLNLSSIEQNYQKKQDIVKVDKALIEILDSLEDRIKARNISVITNIAKCETVGDAKLIDELIRNLIDNAIKYNVDNGKIMITLNTSTLTIEDTGIGISKEYQSRVFERFYRVDKGHSKEIGGTGLGLAIVKHICEIYQYELKLESTIGKGTKITIKFE
ncbi:sensor histidine kinase [Firmicutes bacterium CAG:313]|nr:sensor histidine kinase [Firmicutes bacterium CAG:313]